LLQQLEQTEPDRNNVQAKWGISDYYRGIRPVKPKTNIVLQTP